MALPTKKERIRRKKIMKAAGISVPNTDDSWGPWWDGLWQRSTIHEKNADYYGNPTPLNALLMGIDKLIGNTTYYREPQPIGGTLQATDNSLGAQVKRTLTKWKREGDPIRDITLMLLPGGEAQKAATTAGTALKTGIQFVKNHPREAVKAVGNFGKTLLKDATIGLTAETAERAAFGQSAGDVIVGQLQEHNPIKANGFYSDLAHNAWDFGAEMFRPEYLGADLYRRVLSSNGLRIGNYVYKVDPNTVSANFPVIKKSPAYPELNRFLELGKKARKQGKSAPVVDWIEQALAYGTPEELAALEAEVLRTKTAFAIRDYANKIAPKLKSGSSSTAIAAPTAKNNNKLITQHNKSSDITWDADEWFTSGGRTTTGPTAYTTDDIATFENHVANEYIPLQKQLIENGSLRKTDAGWEGLIEGNYVKVNPNEYIVSNSSSFKKSGLYYDGQSFYTGVPSEHLTSFAQDGGMSAERWASTNRAVSSTYGPRIGGRSFNILSTKRPGVTLPGTGRHSNSFKDGLPIGDVLGNEGVSFGQTADVLNYIDDLTLKYNPLNNGIGNTRIFMPGVQVKSLRGNNGNFNMDYSSPFAYNNMNENNEINGYYA